MKKVLFINACARPCSRSCELARHVLNRLPGQVEELRLYEEEIRPLDWPALQERVTSVTEGDSSAPVFRYAKQFAVADDIVIAAPYWDLLFPAVLRTYLEAVTVTGLTFRYTPQGMPEGLCRARRLIYVTTAGGPIGERNYGFEYIRALALNFYGIRETCCVAAEGLDLVGADPAAILEQARRNIPDFREK